ncbi:hypothetical protein AURDEDRAFT_117201 [Auricularia subglabra TFB-10046 SS5]|uniref:G-protein coupled receptors family 1 profile domain-containing protein n=1 Tax=Auricularia subglabra (strain TFB-10046 / SS5) TaxID=717982 RepID=J0WSA6_AURST|nr:hypothetical protein AURDEDRAFT_117201 [Auricularia subglabra TFB-10046 SS5]
MSSLSAEGGQRITPLLASYLALHVVGSHVLLPLLLATFAFSRAKRAVVLVNLCVCFLLTSIITCLLFYAGQYKSSGPDAKWCIAQASLVYAVAPMDGMAVLCLMYHVWNSVRIAQGGRQYEGRLARVLSIIPAIAPYVVFVGFATGGASVALANPGAVTLRPDVQFFCTVPDGAYSLSTSVSTAVPLVLSIICAVSIGVTLWRGMTARKRDSTVTLSKVDMQFAPRVFFYGVYVFIGLIFTLVSIVRPSPAPDMFSATIPTFIAVLFGSQSDVLDAWRRLFRRGEPGEKDAWTQVV